MAANWADLNARAISALVLLGLFGLAVFFGDIGLLVFTGGVASIAIWEIGRIIALPMWLQALQIAIGLAALYGAMVSGPLLSIAFLAVWVVLIIYLALNKQHLITVFTVSFALGLFGFITIIKQYDFALLLQVVTIVIVTDVAGYFAGRYIGGPKIMPRISPKKTCSGTVAGWLGAGVCAMIFSLFFGVGAIALGAAVLLSLGSQMGDVLESRFKRAFDVKDSSNIIPGHGGVLDRFDGVLGASLCTLVLLLLGLLT